MSFKAPSLAGDTSTQGRPRPSASCRTLAATKYAFSAFIRYIDSKKPILFHFLRKKSPSLAQNDLLCVPLPRQSRL